MGYAVAFSILAALFTGALVFGFKTGVMPTYLTGGARREIEPLLYWMATAALCLAIAGSLWAAIDSL